MRSRYVIKSKYMHRCFETAVADLNGPFLDNVSDAYVSVGYYRVFVEGGYNDDFLTLIKNRVRSMGFILAGWEHHRDPTKNIMFYESADADFSIAPADLLLS